MFRYPGGKGKIKEVIIKQLVGFGPKEEYREPFFGGGSVGLKLLSLQPFKKVWINDKDIGIASLWTAILRFPEQLQTRIADFIPSLQAFHDFKKELLEVSQVKDLVDIGFKKIAIHQLSYSGLGTMSGGPLGGRQQASPYKINCRWSPEYLCKSIGQLHKQLSSLNIHENECTHYDFATLLGDDTSLVYLDPPYFGKGNDLYQCGFSLPDHQRLAGLLVKAKQDWVLSYDDCSEIRQLYYWAYIQSFGVNYTITALKNKESGKRAATNKQELLIVKY